MTLKTHKDLSGWSLSNLRELFIPFSNSICATALTPISLK